jgi:hypothetical protein
VQATLRHEAGLDLQLATAARDVLAILSRAQIEGYALGLQITTWLICSDFATPLGSVCGNVRMLPAVGSCGAKVLWMQIEAQFYQIIRYLFFKESLWLKKFAIA